MAILGISGYAGTGKDTFGRIIQYIKANESHIAIDDVLNNYEQYQNHLSKQSKWEIKKYAGKLKQIASLLTGIEPQRFEDQEFKKTNLGPEWDYWTIRTKDVHGFYDDYGKYANEQDAFDDIETLKNIPQGLYVTECTVEQRSTSVRQFLQELGTDACRTNLHPNVWVNALMADYIPVWTTDEGKHDPIKEFPNWIVTDVRFPNEAEAIKKAGGKIIRIERPGFKALNQHLSEISLDRWDFDYKIINGSDTVSLMFTVANILKKESLL